LDTSHIAATGVRDSRPTLSRGDQSTCDAVHVPETVAEATFAVLRSFGVDRVFGNPGSTEMRMFVRWPDDLGYVLALPRTSFALHPQQWQFGQARNGFLPLLGGDRDG